MSDKKIDIVELLEIGPVRCKIDGELRQFTRDIGTADTCHCVPGHKSCGFISELEWRDRLESFDKDEKIAVWDIGTHRFEQIVPEDIEKIIGHGEDEEKSCCCKEK